MSWLRAIGEAIGLVKFCLQNRDRWKHIDLVKRIIDAAHEDNPYALNAALSELRARWDQPGSEASGH